MPTALGALPGWIDGSTSHFFSTLLVKVEIADRVLDHAKRLGYTQTPTLNASISGNISLAVRRTGPSPKGLQDPPVANDLTSRIAVLRSVPDMLDRNRLTQRLKDLTESVRSELAAQNKLSSLPIYIGEPIRANKIPTGMHRDIVNFANQKGLQSRHDLTRLEEDLNPLVPASLGYVYQYRKKEISYEVGQSDDLPESAVILDLPGDGRCVPPLKILLYVLPLQITTCLAVFTFRVQWPPKDRTLTLLSATHEIEKPGAAVDHVKNFAPFAVKKAIERLNELVRNRIEQLEKEISG